MKDPDAKVKYCVYCGTELVEKEHTGQNRLVCPQCEHVHFDDPKVAVAVMLINKDKILLVRRSMQPERGKWTMPGGYLDSGEQPEEAAARECKEETDLEVDIGELLELVTGKEHPRGPDLLLIYRGRVKNGTLSAGDDADKAGWFKLEDLPPLAFRPTRLVVKKYFRNLILRDRNLD